MRIFLVLLGITLAGGGCKGVSANDIQAPIDSEVKASIVAATKHFHQQNCVSDEFRTSLEELQTYWVVTLTDDGRDGSIECNPTTVYVCKSNAKVVFDDPVDACSE